ncbi:hypothetical protein IDZ91_06990 [Pseudomonas aeruginosa]|nr:hypothetical protein [Pseudomonas aeruginosa]
MPEPVERIIRELLQKRFLTKQKRSLAAFHREVAQACKTQKLPVPARNTVAPADCRTTPGENRPAAGAGRTLPVPCKARVAFRPKSPLPLEQVQIDHTVIDLIVVDERDRQPIGRPYLTLANRRIHPLRGWHGGHVGSAIRCIGRPVPCACRRRQAP